MTDCYLGIEIGGTKLQAVIGDGGARILDRRRMVVDLDKGAAGIRAQIERAVAELTASARPRAAAIGFGGPVDHAAGRIAISHHVEGWNGFDIAPWLERVTGIPTQLENDTNTAALAEALRGAGKGVRLVSYVNFGSGMGGGMVVDGRLYHGDTPGEAEVGLLAFDKEGHNFESLCSGWAVDAKVRRAIAANPGGALARLAAGATRGEARFLAPAIEQGDAGARAILDEVCENIAWALSHVVHLFHPQILILGGGLSLIGEPLRSRVAARLPGFLTTSFRPGPPVVLSALGEDVVVVGALLLAMEKAASPRVKRRDRENS